MKSSLLTSIKILLVFTVITGFMYPALVTGIVQVIFPRQANGSLIIKDSDIIGSDLIGQSFDSSIYFWSRPSAIGYNPLPSSGSNLGPTSEKLRLQKEERLKTFIESNLLEENAEVPGEMLFASSSGLDPHVSPEAAVLQIGRIVKMRNFNETQRQELISLIGRMTEKPQFGVLGNERINVLMLNLELDKIK